MFPRSPIGINIPPDSLPDGAYWVQHNRAVGGFVIENGVVTRCAESLYKRFDYWLQFASRIGDA